MLRLSTRRALLYGLAFAVVWVLLAFFRRDVTFHLAPLIVAASVPWVMVFEQGEQPSVSARLVAAGLGLSLALAATLLLDVTSRLEGPSLIEPAGALASHSS